MTLATAPSRIDRETIADAAARGAGAHAAAGDATERRRSPPAARSADESHSLGPRSHRPLRGAVAHPEPRWAGRVRRDAGIVQSVRAPAEHSRVAPAPGPGRVSRNHGRDPAPGPGPARRCRPGCIVPAPPGRLRLPNGPAARVPARRDDPPDAAAQAGRALHPARPPGSGRRRRARNWTRRDGRDGALPRRYGVDRHRRPACGLRQ